CILHDGFNCVSCCTRPQLRSSYRRFNLGMTNELQFSLDQCSSANVGAGRSKRQPRSLAFRRTRSRRFYAVVRFAPQATADDITNFLRAYKATVVEGPLNIGGRLYPIP